MEDNEMTNDIEINKHIDNGSSNNAVVTISDVNVNPIAVVDKNDILTYKPKNIQEGIAVFTDIAKFVKDSVFAENFTTYTKDADGKQIPQIRESDIVMCLLAGAECGFSITESLNYGRNLNKTTIMKINKGRQLGIDKYTSMEGIHIISTGNGDVVQVGIHILTGLLLSVGVEIIDVIDNEPGTIYYFEDGTFFGYNKPKDESKYNFISFPDYVEVCTANALVAYKKEFCADKRLVIAVDTLICEIELRRTINGKLNIARGRFSLYEATMAGLYKGVTILGEPVKGKSNWNNYPALHNKHRCLAPIARKIAADKIGNIYLPEEF